MTSAPDNFKLLFVWPITRISVWDVASGYRKALGRLLGDEHIRDFRLDQSADYHLAATLSKHPPGTTLAGLSDDARNHMLLLASQPILSEAVYHGADCVLMIAAFGVHPAVLWSLRQVGIKVAILLTESPYDDVNQGDWVSVYPEAKVFTNELTSANRFGWNYLRHAYDPEVHYPRTEPSVQSDVLVVGTGWPNRCDALERVNWTGIDLQLYGYWPINDSSPLKSHIKSGKVSNTDVPGMYAGTKIVPNIHRHAAGAHSIGPRLYEAAACGAFQISDWRPELDEVFGGAVPNFIDPTNLDGFIQYYMAHPEMRRERAEAARNAVSVHTFDNRALELVAGMVA